MRFHANVSIGARTNLRQQLEAGSFSCLGELAATTARYQRENDRMEESALSIRLFGELELRLGAARLPRLESARARSLLAFLLLHRDAPQSRQRLAYMLWPDSTDGQARTNLRHLIHTLRQASPELDRFLDVTPQTVWWRNEVPSWVDVVAFDAAQAAADAPGASARQEVDALREAVDLYRGDLLDGCYDEWVLDVRDRFRERYLDQLQRLAVALAEDGDHVDAIRVGRELLRCDPLREDAHRFLMEVQVAAGDRAGAVRSYHECVSTLQRELGVTPSAETNATYADLLRADADPAADPATDPAADDPAADPAIAPIDGRPRASRALIGREAEWQRLSECWREAEGGHPQLVLVSGEPGVGKTRLVEELASWCAHRGARVASARSYATEGELGYGVVISWLRSGDIAADLRRATLADRSVLARLLPEHDQMATVSASTPVEASELRQRMFEVISRTMVSGGRPTLLIADDAQWADEASLQLLHYLLRVAPAGALLVVATARREDLAETHPLRALVDGLQLIDRSTEIELDRLSRADTESLARDVELGDLDPATVDELYADTEGNPLFIVEAVRAGWTGSSSAGAKLTPKLQAVITARFRPLSDVARLLVGVAATVGREFTAPVLAGAAGVDDVALVSGLDELWRRGLVREHDVDAYDFAHGKIRDVAYESLSHSTRRNNHRLIADTILRLSGDDSADSSGEIARHYDRGGRVDEAVVWYRAAAVHAQRLHANGEAIRLLEHAAALVTSMPVTDHNHRMEVEVLSELSIPLAVKEGFASPRLSDAQDRAVELTARLGIEMEPSLLRSTVMSSMCRKQFATAQAAASELRALAVRRGDDVLRVESDYLLGIGAFWAGTFVDAREHFERVRRDFDPTRTNDHLIRFGQQPRIVCVSRLANTLWFLGFDEQARQARAEALASAEEAGLSFSREVTLVFGALLAIELGEIDQCRLLVEQLSVEQEYRPTAVAWGALVGYLEVLDGHVGTGTARIRRAIEAGPVDHAPGQRATHFRVLVAAHEAAEDHVGGLAAADDALADDGTRIWEAEHRRARAVFLAASGAPRSEVDDELTRADQAAGRLGATGLRARIAQTRSILCGDANG